MRTKKSRGIQQTQSAVAGHGSRLILKKITLNQTNRRILFRLRLKIAEKKNQHAVGEAAGVDAIEPKHRKNQ